MRNIILVYGAIAGVVIIGSVILGFVLSMGESAHLAGAEWLGYLVMIVALSIIFVGVKQYRDRELGGVITFRKGAVVGLGITLIASIIYVFVWEIYLATADPGFINDYAQSYIDRKEAAGVTGAELAAVIAQMDQMKANYDNPLFRLPMTFLEIFPVGALITLISAAILRNSNVLPARA